MLRGPGVATGGRGALLNSPFHLCHHGHLWVLVHRQVPEGGEHVEMTARLGACRPVPLGRGGGSDFSLSYLRPRRSFRSYDL